MPFYDYIHGTMDKLSEALYQSSLKKKKKEAKEECGDVVHLTHLTTPESVFHLQLGFASFASRPLQHNMCKWRTCFTWPVSWLSVVLNIIYDRTFLVESNVFGKLKLHTWAIPRYTLQYNLKWQRQGINALIEEAILEAQLRGSKVVSLGLLNQGEEVNKSGAMISERWPKLNIKIVDGSSLAVAIVLNRIPKGTKQVLFRASLSKLAFAIVSSLCHQGIQVATLYENERLKLSARIKGEIAVSKTHTQKVWIVGEGLREEEELRAPKGTLFIPFSLFPPKKARKEAIYCTTPSMIAPPSLHNLHSCEMWLPRRAMIAARVAGILHALEGWNVHECGDSIFDVDKIWEAALNHGFLPTPISISN